MTLGTISATLPNLLERSDVPDVLISGIAMDSRRISEGGAFLACRGLSGHGLDHLDDALAAGCAAVIYEPEESISADDLPADLPSIAIPGLKNKLGYIADRFFGHPSADVDVIGITGTNGKTTVAWLVAECLQLLDMPCAYCGTLGFGLTSIEGDAGMTTPDVVECHRRLAMLRSAGATHAAMEVSSHALAQGRVDGIRFKAAVFTNLSRDHLDYHGDMTAYAAAKARLFLDHDSEIRIVNVDTPAGVQLAERCDGPVVTVSMIPDARASLVIRWAEATADGFDLSFDSAWGQGHLALPLYGHFNVENAALVLAVMLSLGVPAEDACRALERIRSAPGRLELVADAKPRVLVDYAHTPDAIESVLTALRINCDGRIWCVFGCGGDRDRGKRPLMGRAAERLADRIVITNDNPRSEEPGDIIDDIVAGLEAPRRATVIEDRGAAIAWAIAEAAENDIVLIAGKGHESVQIIGGERVPFSDVDVARAVIEKRLEARA